MKPWPKPYAGKAACLFLFSSLSVLTACSGGGTDADNEGDVVSTPPASSGSSSSGGSSGGGEGSVLHEDFGDGLLVNFDEADTQFFFSQEYKALNTSNPEDARPSFYYPTCCFFVNDNPADGPEVALDQMGIVNDNGNPALLLDTGRFTAGQTQPDSADPDDKDPKKDSTTSDDVTTWGELDLSSDYRISFCVKDAAGTRNMQVYVDNNTSGEANSIWGGGSQGSRIFNVPAGDLIPGKRVEINVPGNITLEPGGETKDIRPQLVGSASSFLQFRVEGGSTVILDDLLVEPQSENGQAALPECTVFQPATAPEAPEAPALFAGDGQITASWSGVVGATGYELAYNTADTTEGATVIAAQDIEKTQHTIEGLENGTEYFVFLRVINSVGTGGWSESASAMPEAVTGDACVPTNQVDTEIPWSVYDGCLSPAEPNSVVFNTSSKTQFDFGSSDAALFSAVTDSETGDNLGTALLDTIEDDPANQDFRSRGEIFEVFQAGYPKHFTAIARIKTDVVTDPKNRGFELQTYFGSDANTRVNMQLRSDQGVTTDEVTSDLSGGRVQLEKFTDSDGVDGGDTDVKADFNMLDDAFHIYHIAFTMTDADTLAVKVYADGNDTPIIEEVSTGRADSFGNNKFRVGEDSSSEHFAEVDWIIWTTNAATAALKPSKLVGELPSGIGELGAYGSTAWTGAELDLAGTGGSAPSGSLLLNESDKVTITAAGGKVDSGSVRKFFAYREISGDFTFTARLASVTTTGGVDFATTGNGNRFGIAVMESVTPPISGDFLDVGRFATIDYYLADTIPTFSGSRAHKLDVGNTTDSKRSRSDISGLAIGDYLRIQVVDESGTPRVIRSFSKDGVVFEEVNSSSFKDEGGVGFPNSWFVGVYGAPGDDLTLEFDQITITQE